MAEKVSFRVACEKNTKTRILSVFKMVSFRGQEKLEPRSDRSPLRV